MSAVPAGVRYLLDTNVVSHVIRAKDASLLARLIETPVGRIAISSVSLAELEYGWQRAGRPPGLRRRIDEFLRRVDVLVWDDDVARSYGDVRAAWEAQGVSLADLDMMIAAHAVAAGFVLVSRDRAFQHVPDRLRLEVW
jgi:tRNA(fMet)-specific endonuclease VapC